MTLHKEYHTLELGELSALSKRAKEDGWRFVQVLAVNNVRAAAGTSGEQAAAGADDARAAAGADGEQAAANRAGAVDLVYSFVHDETLDNYRIENVRHGTAVPSVTGEFLSAFVFENEAHDLFGVNITDIAIDFAGKFYALAQKEPMTILSPAQLAEREKRAKKTEA